MKEVFNSLGATGFNITRNTCIAEPREALGGGGGELGRIGLNVQV